MKFNTEIEYCLVEFKMFNQTYYCLWFSDNRDAFLIDENELSYRSFHFVTNKSV